jgi:hypothetical protein
MPFAPNWTAKAEYLFVDLANASCGFANCGGTNTTVSLNENIIRAGKQSSLVQDGPRPP